MSESTAVATAPSTNGKTSLIVTMAGRYGLEPAKFLTTLEKTIFPSGKNPTQEQVAAFLVVANQYELNPFIKEIYAFPAQGGGVTPIVSVDGWLTIINRQHALDGIEYQDHISDDGILTAITCRIYRKDRSRPNEITEYMRECRRKTSTWDQWPARMLRHKALIQCARQAFGLAGIYDPDEAERIAEATGTAQPIAERTRTRQEELRDKLTAAPVDQVEEQPYVDAEILDPEPEVTHTDATVNIIDEVTNKTPDEGATVEEETPKSDESKYEDLMIAVKEKISELTGGEARKVKEVMKGRVLTSMDLKQLTLFWEELNK